MEVNKNNNRYAVLQRIPWDEEFTYEDIRDASLDSFREFYDDGCTIRQCIMNEYYHGRDVDMEENGMEKFVLVIAGMLFEIEHDEVDRILARHAARDIRDFETGNYDDLIPNAEDMRLLKQDIQFCKDFLEIRPELLGELRYIPNDDEWLGWWMNKSVED